MTRLQRLFREKKDSVLAIYCTAGYPLHDSTVTVMNAIQEADADIIELGIPYSDPIADGPVIQQSSAAALANGMSIDKLFEQLKGFRKTIHVPVVLMGYMNPVLQFGFEKFCESCAALEIDALILPDMPVFEFEAKYKLILDRYNIHFIFLVTPATNDERVILLDQLSSGFLYAVSSSGTTGLKTDEGMMNTFLKRLSHLPLINPLMVGFGINDKEQFRRAGAQAAGAIIGSAFIKALADVKDVKTATKSFISSILH